jgi:hypothetical protein
MNNERRLVASNFVSQAVFLTKNEAVKIMKFAHRMAWKQLPKKQFGEASVVKLRRIDV